MQQQQCSLTVPLVVSPAAEVQGLQVQRADRQAG
jgi:hypothetical protein